MYVNAWFWIGFNAFIVLMLALDLAVFHRRAHEVRMREAALWSAVWVALSLLFALGLWFFAGNGPALAFLTGYVIEKSLSVDNLFVFVTIFSYFAVDPRFQHRVLFWGILGAAIMRGLFVAAGAYLLHRFDWVLYVFGGLLVFTAVRMAMRPPGPSPAESNRLVHVLRRLLPVTQHHHNGRFLVRENGHLMATPLLFVLILIELTDVLFAVDSIPAIFAVTRQPFLVYSATMLAVLGLRAMYFLLAGVVYRFRYLHYGLALILFFVGVKMLVEDLFDVPVWVSLLVILGVITLSILLSLRAPPLPRPGPAIEPDATSEA